MLGKSMLSMLFQQPFVFLAWIIAFLLALSVHEFSHALVSGWLGDATAKRLGRLTLNPAAHVDVVGLIAVLLIGFGWGKPVPYNPYNLKWQKWGPAVIAAAGPLSNLILAIVSVVLLALLGSRLGTDNLLVAFLHISSQLNVALMAFNLIPLPPLDGSKALLSALSHPRYDTARIFLETRGPSILILLIAIDALTNLGLFYGLFFWAMGLVATVVNFLGLSV